MSNENHTIQNLESIIVEDIDSTPRYSLRYVWTEQADVNIAHPVYTGNMAADGTLNLSRTFKAVRPHVHTSNCDETVPSTKEECTELKELAELYGIISNQEVIYGGVDENGDDIITGLITRFKE